MDNPPVFADISGTKRKPIFFLENGLDALLFADFNLSSFLVLF